MITDIRGIVGKLNEEFGKFIPEIEYFDYIHGVHEKLMFLRFISDANEKNKFDSLCDEEKKLYKSLSPKIYLPSMSISDVINAEEVGNKSLHYEYITSRTVQLLNLISDYEKRNAFVLYLVLHEFGHYEDFNLYDRNIYEYRQRDLPCYQTIEDKRNVIQCLFGDKNHLEEHVKKMIIDFHRDYYSMPSEKSANDFADEKFAICYQLMGW